MRKSKLEIINQLFGQLETIVMSQKVKFGLFAQGHIPTIEKMLEKGNTWEEIGNAINWHGPTAKEHYEWYLGT